VPEILRGVTVLTGYGGPEMETLLAKFEVQVRTALFLQGYVQRKFGRPEVSTGGWNHYVRFEWPLMDNMAAVLDIQ
ncbi:hypothetical protein HAX54_024215, partial [Datura stramonium]|nr:hypothetical protein [Datura stramonium]